MSKAENQPAPTGMEEEATTPATSNVVDLMAALQASIDRADTDTGEAAPAQPRKTAPTKKTTKATAKKTAAKKTTAGVTKPGGKKTAPAAKKRRTG
ncbi:hypothetical protein ACFQ2B_36530 [Streptomyces stramineus]|uniref:Uncharacterized protein n=1 Tax=Streptomyces stramineus TaxID=173861 RepID=A0ABN0ZDA6_9ACTN